MRQNPHVRICGGPGSATTLVYPTGPERRPRHSKKERGRFDPVPLASILGGQLSP